MKVSVIYIGIVDGIHAHQILMHVGRPSYTTHKEECDTEHMRRGACTLNLKPSRHGKAQEESSPEEEKGRKEEEKVISSFSDKSPPGLLSFHQIEPGNCDILFLDQSKRLRMPLITEIPKFCNVSFGFIQEYFSVFGS